MKVLQKTDHCFAALGPLKKNHLKHYVTDLHFVTDFLGYIGHHLTLP